MNLAQVNIARMLAPLETDIMADFVANLDPINTLADRSEGFIWRLQGDENNATALRVFEDNYLIINMSVWKDLESLFQFVNGTEHLEIYKRKKEWFHKMTDHHMAFWYVEKGHEPTPDEAKNKLEYLSANGESPLAFTFKNRFSPSDLVAYLSLK